MNKNFTYEMIHRFLNGEMSSEEKLDMENEMNINEKTKQKVEMEKMLLQGIEIVADSELKKSIKSVHNDFKAKGFFSENSVKETKVLPIWRQKKPRMVLSIAASFVVLLVSWILFKEFSNSGINSGSLYANYYQPEKRTTNILLDEYAAGFNQPADSKESRLRIALDLYNNGAYQKSLQDFSSLDTDFPDDPIIQFYIAISNMELGNYENSIKVLRPLTRLDNKIRDGATWYLALALLKNDHPTQEIKDLLNTLIGDQRSSYQEKAVSLLKELQNS